MYEFTMEWTMRASLDAVDDTTGRRQVSCIMGTWLLLRLGSLIFAAVVYSSDETKIWKCSSSALIKTTVGLARKPFQLHQKRRSTDRDDRDVLEEVRNLIHNIGGWMTVNRGLAPRADEYVIAEPPAETLTLTLGLSVCRRSGLI
jgi:hypothetical protein